MNKQVETDKDWNFIGENEENTQTEEAARRVAGERAGRENGREEPACWNQAELAVGRLSPAAAAATTLEISQELLGRLESRAGHDE